MVHRLLVLSDMESIWDVTIPSAYETDLRYAVLWGDHRRARVLANRACVARMIMCGEHHPLVEQLRIIQDHPHRHVNWAGTLPRDRLNYVDPDVVAGVPLEKPTRGALIESWLWMVLTAEQDGEEVEPTELLKVLRFPRRGETVPGGSGRPLIWPLWRPPPHYGMG
jgi:hypothetical protein